MRIPKDSILQTENYRLRIPDQTDFDFIFSASRFPDFNEGMQWEAPTHKSELIEPLENGLNAWSEGKGYSFTFETKDTPPQRLGRISIRKTVENHIWNIGYWVHPTQQSKGVMTEAVNAILAFGFQKLMAHAITAKYATWNKASEKVLTNNGFTFVRFLEKGFQKKGQWISENEYSLTKEQYLQNQ